MFDSFIFNIMSGKVVELKQDDFEQSLLKSKYSLVDFWAPWCGPCRMMISVIDELANEHKNVNFFKVNVDEENDVASRFRVSSIPFFVLFKGDKVISSKVGGGLKDDFSKWINQEIEKNS